MAKVDKGSLFASVLPQEEVETPLGTFTIRALSRAEVLAIREQNDLTVAEMEKQVLAKALVDPEMTEDEIGQWQAASLGNEIEPVSNAVMRLSGLIKDVVKEAVARFPHESGQ